MAGPFQNAQNPDLQERVPGRTASPLSPSPIAGQPVSFKTNVNRAKTKRWVEAKSVSYDGDDWGDEDEYDDYEEPPPVPKPTGMRKPSQGITGASNSILPGPSDAPGNGQETTRSSDRSDSALAPVAPAASSAPHESAPGLVVRKVAPPSAGSADAGAAKPLPFVRPADIYKRMQEERQKQRQSQESVRPSLDSLGVNRPTVGSSPSPPVGGNQPAYGASTGDTQSLERGAEEGQDSLQTNQTVPSTASQDTPGISLPEVNRLSGFGADFIGVDESESLGVSDAESQRQADSQHPSLQHNPSLGFRSAVNQAFDAPPTPSSTVGSVVRSSSETTSVISPILGSRGMEAEKTPTIAEDPSESAGETAGGRTPTFQPGHRRDLSTPSPGNSPARKPIVLGNEPVPPELGVMSSVTSPAAQSDTRDEPGAIPAESDHGDARVAPSVPDTSETAVAGASETPIDPRSLSEKNQYPQVSPLPLENGSNNDRHLEWQRGYYDAPTPLQIRSDQHPDHESPSGVPQILPSMSTETSPQDPQDTESDRLRKEIMRSLSPTGSPGREVPSPGLRGSQHLDPEPRDGHESSVIPSEYDSYWNDPSAASRSSPQQQKQSGPDDQSYRGDVPPVPSVAPVVSEPARPKLKKRFSWESLSSGEPEPSMIPQGSPPPTEAVEPTVRSQSERSYVHLGPEVVKDEHGELRPTIEPSEPRASSRDHSLSSSVDLSENQENAPERPREELSDTVPGERPLSDQIMEHGLRPVAQSQQEPQAPLSPPAAPGAVGRKLAGFRDILALKSANERIRMFDETREQFAAIDSGLDNWIRLTADALPEHADTIERNGHLPAGFHRPSPSRAKFPKLSSLGSLSLPSSSHQDGHQQSSSPSHARRPSGTPLSGMIHRQQVKQGGKEFLHSAGVFGGKAGGAAKGLFAKGKNKFRGSGADKGSLSLSTFAPRRSLQLPEMTASAATDLNGSYGHSSQRNSIPLGGVPRLPSFKFHESRFSLAADHMVDKESLSHEADRGSDRHIRSFSLDAAGRNLNGRISPTDAVIPEESIENAQSQQENISPDASNPGESSIGTDASETYPPCEISEKEKTNLGSPLETHTHSGDTVKTVDNDQRSTNHVNNAHGTDPSAPKIDASPATSSMGENPTPTRTAIHQESPSITDSEKAAGSIHPIKSMHNVHGSLESISPQVLPSVPSSDLIANNTAGSVSTAASEAEPFMAVDSRHVSKNADAQGRDLATDNATSANPGLKSTDHFNVDGQLTSPNNAIPSETCRSPSVSSLRNSAGNSTKAESGPKTEEEEIPSPTTAIRDLSPLSFGQPRVSPLPEASKVELPTASQISDISQEDRDAPSAGVPRQDSVDAPSYLQSVSTHVAVVDDDDAEIHSANEKALDNKNDNAQRQLLGSGANDALAQERIEESGSSEPHVEVLQDPMTEYPSPTIERDQDVPDEPPPAFPSPDAEYPDEKQEPDEDAPPYVDPAAEPASICQEPVHPQPDIPSAERSSHQMPLHQPLSQVPSISSLDTSSASPDHQHQYQHSQPTHGSYGNHPAGLQPPRGQFNQPISGYPPPQDTYFSQLSTAHQANVNYGPVVGMQQHVPTSRPSPSPISGWAGYLPKQQSQPGNGDMNSPIARSSLLSSLSKQDSDSLRSHESTMVHAAESQQYVAAGPSPEPASENSQPARNKIRKFGKFHRTSLSNTQSATTEGGARKRTFARISGLFGRSSSPSEQGVSDIRKGKAPQVAHQQLGPQHPAAFQTPEGKHRGPYSQPNTAYQPSNDHRSFSGRPPPPGGYYAPKELKNSRPEAFIGGRRLTEQLNSNPQPLVGQHQTQYQPDPSVQPQHLYQPQPQYQQIVPGSHVNAPAHSPPPGNTFAAPYPVRKEPTGPQRGRSHTHELHVRSRSPRSHPPRPEEGSFAYSDYSDPAYQLGTFNSVPKTPRVGDQERPWNITLPSESQEKSHTPHTRHQPTKLQRPPASNPQYSVLPAAAQLGQHHHESMQHPHKAPGFRPPITPTPVSHSAPAQPKSTARYSSTSSAPAARRFSFEPESDALVSSSEHIKAVPRSTHPHRDEAAVVNKTAMPVELPIRSDDSSEEIVMSSTAYPGQEWQPAGFSQWEHY